MTDLIIRRNNETFGADPRELGVDTLNAAGHVKRPLLRVLRANCVDCCGGNEAEVRKCTAVECDLWPYRMGTNPFTGRKGNPGALNASSRSETTPRAHANEDEALEGTLDPQK